ncbi:MAG: polysaccharide ABC transporter ATP-binding protein [Spirochaetes bacterium RBG_13_68_11]|nr:MAG: polysaccharide ABC transporter ATP-binding protein [Spirochaetes bacterium RBG_13_68_11]
MSSLAVPGKVRSGPARTLRVIWRHRAIYVMLAAPLLYFLIFRYAPLWNAQIAFKDFSPIDGVMRSPWIGFRHFLTFFHSIYFGQLIRNTLGYSLAKLLVGMPTAILLALGLAETASRRLRSVVQTASYLPHFLSWVIMYGILLGLLSPGDGLINDLLKRAGLQPIAFLTEPRWFPVVVVVSDVWKEAGWSAIIFLAGLLGIDTALYEAAAVEGASRMQRIRWISLPGILPVVVVITLLRLGNILDAGFQQIFVLYSLPVYSVSDILDTWIYRSGVLDFQLSLASAVGLFKGVIGLALIVTANRLAKRVAGSGLY